jgi:hypothetical protein
MKYELLDVDLEFKNQLVINYNLNAFFSVQMLF